MGNLLQQVNYLLDIFQQMHNLLQQMHVLLQQIIKAVATPSHLLCSNADSFLKGVEKVNTQFCVVPGSEPSKNSWIGNFFGVFLDLMPEVRNGFKCPSLEKKMPSKIKIVIEIPKKKKDKTLKKIYPESPRGAI